MDTSESYIKICEKAEEIQKKKAGMSALEEVRKRFPQYSVTLCPCPAFFCNYITIFAERGSKYNPDGLPNPKYWWREWRIKVDEDETKINWSTWQKELDECEKTIKLCVAAKKNIEEFTEG